MMKRILITGMSGTGKSTVIRGLAARGHKAVDLDCDDYSEWVVVTNDSQPGTLVEVDRDWVWREDRVQELLSTDDGETLFVSGCASNMGKFRQQFDCMILLSAAAPVILHRLKTRQSNQYAGLNRSGEKSNAKLNENSLNYPISVIELHFSPEVEASQAG